jgi:hypothetical protein
MAHKTFAIPTYRLRDVGETLEQYDESFWRNGHAVPMVVFDDSSLATHEKYFGTLEATRTHNEIYYVGPKQKAEFVGMLVERLRDDRLESVVKNLFRPSYGGNRNFTLMYTLGGLLVSADDDMRPSALIENSVESLGLDEISRGKLVKASGDGFTRRSYDVLRAFDDVLGRRVAEVPANYATGGYLVDTAMDLETNATKGVGREKSLLLQDLPLFDPRARDALASNRAEVADGGHHVALSRDDELDDAPGVLVVRVGHPFEHALDGRRGGRGSGGGWNGCGAHSGGDVLLLSREVAGMSGNGPERGLGSRRSS